MTDSDFAAWVQPHFNTLYRLAYRLTANVHDAEDLFQDVLVKLYARFDELEEVREPGPWLNKVLYHHFVDDRRRYARQPLSLVDPEGDIESCKGVEPGESTPEQDLASNQQQHRLKRALRQLSEEHREVVLLHDSEGYSLPELEAMTGVPIGTLKSRLHRARTRLRQLLKKDGTFSPDSPCSSVDGVKCDAM